MKEHTSRPTVLANSQQEVGIMKNAKSTMLKLLFGALVISSFAACSQIPEPTILDNDDLIVSSDGSSQKIPGAVLDGEQPVLPPSETPILKWGFPSEFPAACNTSANIVKNPKFMLGIVNGGSGNNLQTAGTAQAANWTSANGTPQLSPIVSGSSPLMGHSNPGYMQMWGYKDGGEAIRQVGVPFAAGSYEVYISAVQFNETTSVTPLRFRLLASTGAVTNPWLGSAGPQIIDEAVSTSNSPYQTTWKKFGPYPITVAAGTDTITIASSNTVPYAQANPKTTSWGRYDNVCILPKQPSEKSDVSIRKELKSPAIAGQANTYILNLTNTGPGVAGSPVTVTDVLPAGVTYTPSIVFPAGWTCNTSSLPTITCTTPFMPVGSVQIFIPVTFNATQLGSVENCASLSVPNDTNSANNKSCIKNSVKNSAISEGLAASLEAAVTQLETAIESSDSEAVATQKATGGLKETLKTQVRLASNIGLNPLADEGLFELIDNDLKGSSVRVRIQCKITYPPLKARCSAEVAL
jgi:uncharacterized repeat protein (TIGR01451 family)